MTTDAAGGRARNRWVAAVTLTLALLLGQSSDGLIIHSITVDGNVSDWGDVLTDPENVVADAGSFSDPPDPDAPGTADRDLRGVAFTWDSTNLYFFFRRTLSGNSSFDFLAYIDLGHDGRLHSSDVILRLSYSGNAYSGGELRRYVPVNAVAGDAITGDGVKQPGSAGAVIPGTPGGANSPDGIEFEARIAWSALGVAPGTCLWIHPSIARGINLPSQVEDNTDPLDTQDIKPSLVADRVGSAASPGQVDHAHRACHQGTCTETLDLTVRSPNNWRIQLFTDPNGDGNPSDGVLLATDGNGDGDYQDTRDGDDLRPGADTNGNELPDTGSLTGGQCFNFVVRVFVPSGTPAGTVDIESVRARSATRPRDLVRNSDQTNVGPITVFSDERASGFLGGTVWIAHRACNHQAFTDTILLTAASTLGWTADIWSDPNGDGDPSDAAPATSTGALAPGSCSAFFVRVLVPAGATPGSEAQVTVTGRSQASASVVETALDRVTAASSRFALTPNHDRDAGPGNVLFLPHLLTNHQAIRDSFALTAVSGQPGYTLTLLTDPNGNGEPDDSTTIPNGGVIGPVNRNGGTYRFLLRVDVPTNAAVGSTNTITVTARSQADTSRTSVATDLVRVRRILTYSDPLFARPSKTFFTGCSRVYVQAHALVANRSYRFVWTDPTAVQRRISPTYSPDARGRADDAYSLPCGIVPGAWAVKLQERSGSNWVDTASGTAEFSTLDPGTQGGTISRLTVDQPVYNKDGESISVETTFDNTTPADYIGTFADTVIFRDQNNDGVPTAGEPYIRSDGTRANWAVGERTHRTEPIGILAGDTYEDYFRIDNAQFGIEGTWCAHVRWVQRCNSGTCSEIVIATRLTCFLVSCLPVPDVDAGADKRRCIGTAVALVDATSNGNTHQWSDGGAGGTFSPSATVLRPSWTAPAPGSYTLTLQSTFTATGCRSQDTVGVIIDPLPVLDAGSNRTTCAGDGILLSEATSNASQHLWSSGGAGGTFTPSATVLNPTYTPPDPSPGSVTLTLTSTFPATGCSNSDTLAVTVNPNPITDAGANKVTCAGDPIALSDAVSSATIHQWSSGGAGGTFSPSATVLNPTYTPPDPAPASITLTLTSTLAATGCDTVDTLLLAVNANPVADAGANKVTCAGDPIALSDATSNGTAHAWSDGGAGGAFSPSSSVLNPTYTPPDPSPSGITLTLTSSFAATGCDTVDTLALTVRANPAVDAGADKTTCAGDGVALADATSTGTVHAWSDGGAGGAFTPSSSVLNPTYVPPDPSPASITLTLTSTIAATGCDSVDTLLVTVRANPVVDAGADKTTCAGDPIALADATSSGTAHAWSDGGAGGAFSPSSSVLNPTYAPPDPSPSAITLTLTSSVPATGCDTVDTLALTVRPNPVADAGPPKATCAGDGLTLAEATSNGDIHAWSDGGAGGSFTPSAGVLQPTYTPPDPSSGTVTLTLTSSFAGTGCDTVDTVPITVHPNPVMDAGADKATCAGAAIALSDATSNGTQHAWDDGGAGGAFSPSASALNPTYTPPDPSPATVTLTLTSVTTATSCDTLDTLVLTVNPRPIVDAGADASTCAAQAVVLSDATSNGSAHAWTDGGAGGSFSPSPSVLNPTYTPADPSPAIVTLTLTSTVGGTGCQATDARTLTVNPRPAVDAGVDRRACAAAGLALSDATASGTDQAWSDGGAGGTFSPSSATLHPTYTLPDPAPATITLTLTSTIAATGCSRADSLVVTADPRPVVEAGAAKFGCAGTSVALSDASGGAADVFAWSDGGAGGTFAPSAAVLRPSYANGVGTFTLTLTATISATGCAASDAVSVTVQPRPVAEAGPDKVVTCATPSVQLEGSASGGDGSLGRAFAWTPAGPLDDPSAAQPRTSTPGTYVLTVTDVATGCASTDSVTVTRNADAPVASAGDDRVITCRDPSVVLDGQASGGDGSLGYAYAWSPAAGLSDPSVARPVASTGGTWTLLVTDVATGCVSAGDSVTVTRNDARPTADAGPDRQITCTVTTVLLSGSASGGDGSQGYAYAWSPAAAVSDASSATPTTSIPGTYTLTVTAIATGCTHADDVIVTRDPAVPIASAGPDQDYTCRTQFAQLEGSASGGDGSLGYSYRWEPAATVSDPNIARPTTTTPGTYTLTVTAIADGCTAQDVVVIHDLRAAPVTSAGPDAQLDCARLSVTLAGSASGTDGRSGYDYAWTPQAGLSDPTSPTPVASLPGTFTLRATDRYTGCSSTDTVVVTRNVAPPVASAGPDRVLDCRASVVTLLGSASGGDGSAGYAYAWMPAGLVSDPASPTPTTSSTGTFTLTVRDLANGCVASDEVLVTLSATPPIVNAGPDRSLDCRSAGVTLLGSASGGDASLGRAHAWSPAAGLSDPSVATPVATQPGTYTLTVTDIATGCSASDTVEVAPPPPPPVADAGPDADLACGAPNVTLTGSASGGDGSLGYDARWEPASVVSDPDVFVTEALAAGTFTLTVTDRATGCSATDTVSVRSPSSLAVSAGPPSVISCAVTVATLRGAVTGGDASLGRILAWSPAGLVSDPAALVTTTTEPGTYALTVTDIATGCRATSTVTIPDDRLKPVVDAGPDRVIACGGAPAQLAGSATGGNGSLGYSHRWSPAWLVADPTSPATTATAAGDYVLTVTDLANGCSASDTMRVTVTGGPLADAGPDTVASCAQAGTLSGSASGGDGSLGYSFAWSPPALVADASAAVTTTRVAGTYLLVVTDLATGCTGTDTVTVGPLAVPAPADPSALDLRPSAPPLLVRWEDWPVRSALVITWEDTAAPGYALHSGFIPSVGPPGSGVYDHAPLACGLTVPQVTVPQPGGNRYFLAVAVNCEGIESSYGRTSRGAERPDSVASSGLACP